MDVLQTWDASSYLQAISESLKLASSKNMEIIVPGSPLGSGIEDFSILMSESSSVTLVTVGGQTVTATLPAGYNPIRVKSVTTVVTGTAIALY